MPKFQFINRYEAPNPPKELIIEAENEDEAWDKFAEQVLTPITDAFTCDGEMEEGEGS